MGTIKVYVEGVDAIKNRFYGTDEFFFMGRGAFVEATISDGISNVYLCLILKCWN